MKTLNVEKDYQDLQFASSGLYGQALKGKRTGAVTMFADNANGGDGKSPFFEFPTAKLDGTEVKRIGDIVDGKKAILIVNVASE